MDDHSRSQSFDPFGPCGSPTLTCERIEALIGTVEGYPRSHHSYPKFPSSRAPFQNGGRKH